MKKIYFLLSLIILFSNNYYTFSQNPLSIANEFNILTEGNLTITQGDIEGAIGVGGNLIVLGNSQRTSSNKTGGVSFVTIGGVQYALIVGGDLAGTVGGNIFKVDGKSGSTSDHYIRFKTLATSTVNADGGGIDIGNPANNPATRFIRVNSTDQAANTVVNPTILFDFAAAFAELKAKSIQLTNCLGNTTATNSGGQAMLNLGNNTTNVWNVSGTDLNSFSQINLSGTLPNASNPLIINVDASGTFNWQNKKIVIASEGDDFVEINRAPYILYNFYNTTTLNIQSSNLITASILAPLANLTYNGSGNITGQVIAKTFAKPNAGELHIARFNANVACACTVATVEAGNNAEICANLAGSGIDNIKTVQLNGVIGGSATSATWSANVAGGSFSPDANTLNAIYTPPIGVNTVILTLTTNDPAGNCAAATDQITVTQKPCVGIVDPCSCHTVVYKETDILEVIDFVEVDSTPYQTWWVKAQSGMQYIDNLVPLDNLTIDSGISAKVSPTVPASSAPGTGGEVLVETPAGSGIYRLDFAHDSGVGYNVVVTNGSIDLTINNLCYINNFDPTFTIGTTVCTTENPIPLTATIEDTGAPTNGITSFYYLNSMGQEVGITEFNPADPNYPLNTPIKIYVKYTPVGTVIDCELVREANNLITIENCALPVNLLNFNGNVADEAIVLNWKTAEEKNFSHFEIQKGKSLKEFGTIGSITGTNSKYYHFSDKNPELADNYYRLKMVNNDGSYDFSRIININYEKNKNFVNIENPTNGSEINIATNIKNAKFILQNQSGMKIEANIISNGYNKYVVKPINKVSGLYFLNIISEGKIVTKKVIIP